MSTEAKCSECGYRWVPRGIDTPHRCPKCGVRFTAVKKGGGIGCAVAVAVLSIFAAGVAADKPDAGRAVAGKEVVTLGGVTVSVSRIGLYPSFWREAGERFEMTDDLKRLNIDVTVSAADGAKKVDYRTWRSVPGVQAVDKFGNKYELLREKSGQTFTGAVPKAVVSKGEPATDRLLFEKPIGDADWIDIDLPGEAVGVKGEVFRFRVIREAWTPAPPKKGPNLPKKK